MARLKLLGVVFLVAAAGLIAGTGAFQTVSADRTASITTAGDESALLQLTPYSGPGGNGGIADITNGQLQISNLNVQSTTDFDKVFVISNHGTQSVGVWITDEGTHPDSVTFYNPSFGGAGTCENGVESIEGQSNAVYVGVGDSIAISLLVDTTGLGQGVGLIDTMIIHADAGVNGATSGGDCGGTGGSDDDGGDSEEDDLRVTPDAAAEPVTIANGQQTFTIHNDGDDPLTVTISLAGANPDQFQLSGATSTTIPANGSPHQVTVTAVDASDGSTAVLVVSADGETVERDIQD